MNRNELLENVIDFINNTKEENFDEWKSKRDSVYEKLESFNLPNINYVTNEQLNELAAICGFEKIKENIFGLFDPDLEDVSISSCKDFISNRKVDYRVYTSLSAMSNREPDKKGSRYIYLDKVDKNIKELAEILGLSTNMLQKHIRALRKMKVEQFLLEEYNGKLVYRLNYADTEGKNFVTIPMDKIPLLLNGLSNNCIKLYTILMWACRTGEKQLTQSWLAEQIGLSKRTERAIRDSINVLEKCGLIRVRKEFEIKHRMENGKMIGYKEPRYFYSLIN